MSINAIEVLEARMANRGANYLSVDWETFVPYPLYHSPEWWDMLWKKHEEWREGNYPAAAGTGWEVTPPTGVDMTEPIRYGEIKSGKCL